MSIPVPYELDSWKKKCPAHLASKIRNATPNLILFLSDNGHIPRNTVKVKDRTGNAVDFNFKTVFTEFYIPDSYPRFGHSFGYALEIPPEIPHCKSFKYFRGKAVILEWEIKTGKEYEIQLSAKNYETPSSTDDQLSIRIGILTPFKRVRFCKSYLGYASKTAIETVQQKMIQYFEDKDRPGTISFTAEPNSIFEKQFINGVAPMCDANKNLYSLTPEPGIVSDDYSIFGLSLRYRVSHENLSISTFIWEQPIPTAFSQLLMDAKFGLPPLCQYSVINNSKKEVVLTIKTEVEGFTHKQEDRKIILPYSIECINHTPLFKKESSGLKETCIANLKTSVFVNNETIAQKTTIIELLAFDTMIWEILNPLTRENFSLHDFITVWVTPHDKEVENIISIAKEFHPSRILQGYSHNLPRFEIQESINLQCKAIFQALKSIGLSYVDSSISFGWSEPYASQRIKLPFLTITIKAANCIDGTVLFASLLENIKIQPIVILIPGHALVGWKPFHDSREIIPLETTRIAAADFETAIRNGHESLNRGLEIARKIAKKPDLTIDDASRMGYIRFIDVGSMREKKIFPQITP
jgi:hypothetical protein